ncbi:MAG: DUF368 domain-containing protein [Oscillospiraceae bacterium]|jgi:putative membrane protein|nr:DUF368 domain-containing protein [Oscillospiraceae bacterium]
MTHIINVLKGSVIGIANAIPGVSGGTMMVVLKVFDRIMESFTGIKQFKKNLLFLVTVGLGIGIGILITFKLLSVAFDRFYVQIQFFFLGVILATLPLVFKIAYNPEKSGSRKFKPADILPFAAGIAVILLVSFAGDRSDAAVITALTPGNFAFLFFAGVIGCIAMLLPGLSGSLVLVILGAYESVSRAADFQNLNIPVLIPAILGIAVGFIAGAKLITACLKKFYTGTYCLILGLITGSLYAVYPKPPGETFTFSNGPAAAAAIGAFAVGIGVVILMEFISKKQAIKSEN